MIAEHARQLLAGAYCTQAPRRLMTRDGETSMQGSEATWDLTHLPKPVHCDNQWSLLKHLAIRFMRQSNIDSRIMSFGKPGA